jgi:hypothetical protein
MTVPYRNDRVNAQEFRFANRVFLFQTSPLSTA